jgi:IS5 family transposase
MEGFEFTNKGQKRSPHEMREKYQDQMPLMSGIVNHPYGKELEEISRILDSKPTIIDLAYQDLTKGGKGNAVGAKGMTAEQVFRAAILKQMNEFSYEELAFHIVDSSCYRWFCKIGIADKGFKSSAICANVKSLSPETWQSIHALTVDYGRERGIEKGRQTRIDCTVVDSNIHDPKDSMLLWDSVRVLTRILKEAAEELDYVRLPFKDHTRVAKRRMLGIENAKTAKQRNRLYKDILKVASKTIGYAVRAIDILEQTPMMDLAQMTFCEQLKHYCGLAKKVEDQTYRRVVLGQQVPASEKIVSIFEPHTDIIKKDRRDTFYGHKICLTGGASNLILDCLIVEGNPADSTLTDTMLDRQKDIYGRYPLKVALDGGFASRDNLNKAKDKGIKDVCFAKGRGLQVEDMCRSEWVFKRLRRFRAGIESGISWMKRAFGLSRCTWKGHRSFKSYVWSAIVSANLLTLARHNLEQNEA